jgi:O-antigen ligase
MSEEAVALRPAVPPGGGAAPSVRRVTPQRVAFFFLLVFAASVPLEAVAHLGPLGSTARIAGIAAAGAGAYSLCTDLRPRPANRTFFLFGAFVLWAGLSYFWSEDPGKTFARTFTYLQLLLLAWFIWQEARSSRACAALMKAYVAGSAVACADAIITRKPVHKGVARFSIGDPNDFGVVVVIAMVMAYYVAVSPGSRRIKGACALFLPIGAVAIFLTASRTAVAALLVATLVMLLDRRNLSARRLASIALLTAVSALVVGHSVSQAQLERIGSTRSEVTSGSLDQRTTQWSISFQTFSSHPIFGVGAGSFRDISERETGVSSPAHSAFLGVLADTGAPGLLLFVAVLVTLIPELTELAGNTRRAWIAIALVWLMGALTLSWEHRKVTWFLIFLLASQIAASRQDGASRTIDEERWSAARTTDATAASASS